MTERKPAWETPETFAERLIREARERGELSNLAGEGKPLPGLDDPPDELWWVKQKLRLEGLSFVPPELELRTEVARFKEGLAELRTEQEVRARGAELNEKICEQNRTVVTGPMTELSPFDLDWLVERWRTARKVALAGSPKPEA